MCKFSLFQEFLLGNFKLIKLSDEEWQGLEFVQQVAAQLLCFIPCALINKPKRHEESE
jgi:hypothetical protein